MKSAGKLDTVMESLDVFKALRMTLAYLRCVSITFGKNWRSGPFTPITLEKWNLQGTRSREAVRDLTFCYQIAMMTMHAALVHDLLCYYKKLVSLNPNLNNLAIEKELKIMVEKGIFEEMRQIRNGIFHIRSNKNIIKIFFKLVEKLDQNGIDLKQIENAFYEYSEFLFVESDIFQRDRDDLHKAFDEAVEYYKTQVEPNLDPNSDGSKNFLENWIIRPDKAI